MRDTRNKAPVFKDAKGATITQAERMVAETTRGLDGDDALATNVGSDNVGSPVMVEDRNIGTVGEGDALILSLGGADASMFRVRQPASPQTAILQSAQLEVASGDEASTMRTKRHLHGDPDRHGQLRRVDRP